MITGWAKTLLAGGQPDMGGLHDVKGDSNGRVLMALENAGQ
jgi:hypothetical protein